jgi:cytochrome P450/NADPH-cytochrome P450 reductase
MFGFHLQDDVDKPMVFVSAGTGYAPMRAFLWERLALQRDGVQLGPAILFNGIRHSSLDYIYRDEIEMFLKAGVLDEAYVAASREHPGERRYVQDHIVERGADVWGLIEQGGYVYTCGSAAMRDGVRSAFVTVLTQHGNMTPEIAEAYMAGLESAENRYRPDVWS